MLHSFIDADPFATPSPTRVVASRVREQVKTPRSDDPFLSVIIPAYNEAARIGQTLESVIAYLETQPWAFEIIVSADGTDGTRQRAETFAHSDPRVRVIGSDARGGKGRGVRNGMLAARGKYVGFIDADYKTPIEEFEKLLPWLRRGFSVVIGSRRAKGTRISRRQPLYRRIGSRAFAFVMGWIVGLRGVRDTQCGFKFFSADAARRIFSMQRIDGYMFDVEVLRLAGLLGYRIKEVGVRWQDDGDSRYAPVTGTWKNARELIRIRRARYGFPQAA
jgi:dolichyl-phosphate beta-glucosyltransferase